MAKKSVSLAVGRGEKLLLPASPWQRMDSVQAVDQDGNPL
jgi:hypothetical protein